MKTLQLEMIYIYIDLVDLDKVRSFRVQKQTSFNFFKVSYHQLHSYIGKFEKNLIFLIEN